MSSMVAPVGVRERPNRTIGDVLGRCRRLLEDNGIAECSRESRDIVAALLDVPRFWPAANIGDEASADLETRAMSAAAKRSVGAPLAYAVGRASFRHLTLDVDQRVLIPRVETEILVERVLERCTADTRTLADIGTGSGALALSFAFERKFERVIATDVSLPALSVAEANARSLGHLLKSPVEFRHGSLLAPLLGEKLDVIVSNPPYISEAEGPGLPASVREWEPELALFSPGDGLSLTRDLIAQAPEILSPHGILALEVATLRSRAVAEMVAIDGRYVDVEVLPDLTGRDRFVFARRI